MSEQLPSNQQNLGPKQPPRIHGERCICGDNGTNPRCPVKDYKPPAKPSKTLVERLREDDTRSDRREAADEIERLWSVASECAKDLAHYGREFQIVQASFGGDDCFEKTGFEISQKMGQLMLELTQLRKRAADEPVVGRALDREDLIVPATRYYMGRQTIGVTAHCRALAKVWPTLSRGTRDTLRRDIEQAFERDDAMRADPVCSQNYYPLGADIDREAWEMVRAAYITPETKGIAP